MCDSIYHKQVGKYSLSYTERDTHTCNSVIFEQDDEQNKKIILIVNYDMRREFENMWYEDDVELYLIRRRFNESIRRLMMRMRAGGWGGCLDRAGESPAKLTGVSIGMVIRYRLQARRVCVPHLPGSIPGRPKVRNVGSNPAKEITLFIVQW